MKSTVIMSIYNGEKYILDQLDSIRLQTLKPDEVILGDDFSTDNTVEIVKKYIEEKHLNWKIIENKENLGWKKNFIQLLLMSTNELIFLSDQDDIWNIHKLELMVPIMDSPNISVLACNYKNVSGELPKVYDTIHKKNKIKQQVFSEKYLYGIPFPGCSFCVKKAFFMKILKYHKDYIPHDAFIYRNALLYDEMYFLNQNLLLHRIHGNNAGSSTIISRKNDNDYYLSINSLLLEALEDNPDCCDFYKKQRIIKRGNIWINIRKKFFYNRSLFTYLKLLKFIKYYPHFKTYIKDLIIAYYREER